MLYHSSPSARVDSGKDRGRRVQERGNLGETWGVGVGQQEEWKGRSQAGRVLWLMLVCECVLDLEPDGGAGVVEVMRAPRGRRVEMIRRKQPPANWTHYGDELHKLNFSSGEVKQGSKSKQAITNFCV